MENWLPAVPTTLELLFDLMNLGFLFSELDVHTQCNEWHVRPTGANPVFIDQKPNYSCRVFLSSLAHPFRRGLTLKFFLL